MVKATRKTIPDLIAKREEFKNDSGTVRGIKNPATISTGMLNEEEKVRLRIDRDTQGIGYVIMSYDTPIAWETWTGYVYKVKQTFTQTTSKHQGMLYKFHSQE